MYLLDANVFIQAKNFYYAFDICPGFWQWIDDAASDCGAYSIVKVYDELTAGGDDLAEWIKQRKDNGGFLAIDDVPTQRAFRRGAGAVQAGSFKPQAKAHFLSKADPWLVAKAMAENAVVVTHEKPARDAVARVPLPNICAKFGVSYVNTFELLQHANASFHLSA